jgi:hypothetical protein
MFEIDYNREYITKCGLHLNDIGKDEVSKQLFSQILLVLHKIKFIPVNLDWKRSSDFLYSTVIGDESWVYH